MFEHEDVDTRTSPPEKYSVTVLGPYVDPNSGELRVSCVQTDAIEDAETLYAFGYLFRSYPNVERNPYRSDDSNA